MLWAQSGGVASQELTFEREWQAQAVPYFRITIRSDGSGERSSVRPGAGGAAPEGTDGATAGTPLRFSEAIRAKVFAAGDLLSSGKPCEKGGKKMAQTGTKTLTLRRGDTVQHCTFNYADDRRLQDAIETFGAIEVTLEEEPRLQQILRYDRLGLDAELGRFTEQVKGGRAVELGNLAPLLRSIAGNGELMERVRNRASDLLAMADAGK